MPRCTVCENEKFYESAGFFYCQICDTQTQDLQRTVNETDFTSQPAFTSRANAFRIGSQIQMDVNEDDSGIGIPGLGPSSHGSLFCPGQPESLFLLVDVVLRSQVEWLIQNAGARKELKDVMRSVWFSYLSAALPDVKDGIAQSLFDGSSWKKSLRKADLSAMGNCKVDDLTRLLNHWKITASSEGNENRQPETLQRENSGRRTNWKPKSRTSDPPGRKFYRCTDPSKISLSRMMALLVIGLHICQESILISDILRWARLLLLPCVDPSSVLPDDQLTTYYLLGKSNDPLSLTCHELEWDIQVLLKFLRVPKGSLPSLSILPVIERLIQELNLPTELIVLVNELADTLHFRWHLDFTARKHDWPPIRPENVEATTMALVIHTLITLFGLNGVSERKITLQSRKIEKMILTDLFDWYDWISHMDQRRLLLFQHSTLIQAPHSVSAELGFIRRNFLTERRKLTWARLTRNKYQDENYEDLQRAFQEAKFHQKLPDFYVDLPVTQRPFRAHTEALIRICPALDVDFSEFSLLHLTGIKVENPSPEVEQSLIRVGLAQQEAREGAHPVGSYNMRLASRKILRMEQVPSDVLRWLITVCAEIIEQRPASLLGTLVHIESQLFSKKS